MENTINNKLEQAENILDKINSEGREIKKIKREKGLIERTESSKIILTEDNRQVLID